MGHSVTRPSFKFQFCCLLVAEPLTGLYCMSTTAQTYAQWFMLTLLGAQLGLIHVLLLSETVICS